MHDVTAEQRAAETLRDSEERYRLLVDSVRDYAIFWLDPAGCVASWSPGAERMTGYRAEEILGTPSPCFLRRRTRSAGSPSRSYGRRWRPDAPCRDRGSGAGGARKRVALHLTIDPALDTIAADPDRLQQIERH